MNKKDIEELREYYQKQNGLNEKIGTLSEKSLHAFLKRYFEPLGNNQEIKIGRYFADIVNEQGIIEIQTRAFDRLRKKLDSFLKNYTVTVVYPVAQIKYLSWINESTGEIVSTRKSPKTGTKYDAFPELYKIRLMLNDPNLHFKIVFLRLTEYRYLNGWSSDGKKGSTRCERIPSEVLGELSINCRNDYKQLVPIGLPIPFCSKDYAKAAKINLSRASTALNVLNFVGAVRRVGKKGNMFLYEISE